ncbi:UPF0575 protein C19orf67 homolog [Cololabis saira]|uniref:UPF0575 protein C19orf67 homolog n=1 Tax=Cololabis saira TaxID=129043 RepID=UPI002AD3A74F|nr:UPF0575 protein C19orf67 homolog [Cololabis saira]
MTDREVQVDVRPENSPKVQPDDPQEDFINDSDQLTVGVSEVESLLMLADVALAPPCGGQVTCSIQSIPSIHLQLQLLLDEANHLHDRLLTGQDHVEREALAAAVLTLLHTCQPFFNHLESAARGTMSAYNHPNEMSYKNLLFVCLQLLDVSQQLSDRLEQLVLAYASADLLCLDETQPHSVSHFCVGRCRLDRLRLTAFRYCQPTPFLARADTGLFKRMRWNVEHLGGEHPGEMVLHTEYFFLCYEDLVPAEGGALERMWSVGQWVQVTPDPGEDDLADWISCVVPHADYRRLLLLGHDEPSSVSATDLLQQLLLGGW